MKLTGGMPMEPKRAIPSQENRRQRMFRAVSDDERLSLYCEALLADPRITMLQIQDMHRPLEMARVFVPLRISQERQRVYDTPMSAEESTETTIADDPNVWIEEERQRREGSVAEIYDPEKAIHTFPRCVIMGGPGAGKTTLLQHLAIMAAQRSMSGMPSLLPIYVELGCYFQILDWPLWRIAAARSACRRQLAPWPIWLRSRSRAIPVPPVTSMPWQ